MADNLLDSMSDRNPILVGNALIIDVQLLKICREMLESALLIALEVFLSVRIDFGLAPIAMAGMGICSEPWNALANANRIWFWNMHAAVPMCGIFCALLDEIAEIGAVWGYAMRKPSPYLDWVLQQAYGNRL